MEKLRVAYQGEKGAYSESALLQYFGDQVECIPCEEFANVFELTFSGEADFGFIPVENSTAGSIHQNYDLLYEYDLHINGEKYYQIHHCLIGLPGTQLEDIKTVISHPQALAQSAAFLQAHHIKAKASFDTAGSVRLIKENGDKSMGALASSYACKVHDMVLLSENVETNQNNTTRFLVISKTPSVVDEKVKTYKATYIFTLPHYPGALSKVLSGIAERSFNLTKIESRPLPSKPWEYIFCIDVSGDKSFDAYEGLQQYLLEQTNTSKLVGIYPASKNPLSE